MTHKPQRKRLSSQQSADLNQIIEKNIRAGYTKKCKEIATLDTGLWFEDRGIVVKKTDIKRTPRIGVSYAGSFWSKRKLRFVLKI